MPCLPVRRTGYCQDGREPTEGPRLDEVSPAVTPRVESPGPDPVTADRVATLERNYTRLRRDMDRMARVMALLEHDLAIERITIAQPTLLDKLGSWIARWVSRLSPWAPRARPRIQRPMA